LANFREEPDCRGGIGTGRRAQGKGHRAQSYWHLFYREILHILNKMVFLFF